jgi:hypothetical protein
VRLVLTLSMLSLLAASCPWWQVLPALLPAKVEKMC